jgi:hypothetical protein
MGGACFFFAYLFYVVDVSVDYGIEDYFQRDLKSTANCPCFRFLESIYIMCFNIYGGVHVLASIVFAKA